MTDKTMNTPPIQVTVIGTGDGADVKNNAVAVTPGLQPNLLTKVIPPLTAIAVRFIHLFLVVFGGALGADALGIPVLLVPDMRHALYAALSAAAVGLLKDLITIFGRLENKYPLITGNI